MTTQTIQLDKHRGVAAQKATEIRRLLSGVEADQNALKARQDELETQLIAAPATTWVEAGEKARYLIGLLSATSAARDPRRKKLIANVLEDLRRLSGADVDLESK
jgi:hypothetical protein